MHEDERRRAAPGANVMHLDLPLVFCVRGGLVRGDQLLLSCGGAGS